MKKRHREATTKSPSTYLSRQTLKRITEILDRAEEKSQTQRHNRLRRLYGPVIADQIIRGIKREEDL